MSLTLEHMDIAGGVYVGNPCGAAHSVGMKFWAGDEPTSHGELRNELSTAVRQPIIDRPAQASGRFAGSTQRRDT